MFAESLFDSVIYVTFQELATRVSHRNTGKACNETVADQLLQRVSADENLHMIFYRDVSGRRVRHRPEPGDERSCTECCATSRCPATPCPSSVARQSSSPSAASTTRDPPRRRRDARAEEVAHLRARRLHRRGRGDARRSRQAGRGTRGNLREVRSGQGTSPRA